MFSRRKMLAVTAAAAVPIPVAAEGLSASKKDQGLFETRPAENVATFPEPITSMITYNGHLLVSCGREIYMLKL